MADDSKSKERVELKVENEGRHPQDPWLAECRGPIKELWMKMESELRCEMITFILKYLTVNLLEAEYGTSVERLYKASNDHNKRIVKATMEKMLKGLVDHMENNGSLRELIDSIDAAPPEILLTHYLHTLIGEE